MRPRDESNYRISREKIRGLKQSNSEDIHIVSAGPSCREFDWQKIRGRDIMTINDSLFHLPLKVSYHIYNEPYELWKKNYEKASKFSRLQRFTTFHVRGWHQLPLYQGKNLAYLLAIHLSIDLGYKKAFLYGYDFDCIDGYIHWWDKEKSESKIIQSKMDMLNRQRSIFEEFRRKISDEIELNEVVTYAKK